MILPFLCLNIDVKLSGCCNKTFYVDVFFGDDGKLHRLWLICTVCGKKYVVNIEQKRPELVVE